MLTIRLQRTGKRNRPAFRLVVTEHTNGPKSGRFLEVVGSHDRILKNTDLKKERIQHWLAHGVKVTDAVQNILVEAGLLTGSKVAVHSRTPGKKKAEANKAAAEAAAKEAEAKAAEAAEAEASNADGEATDTSAEENEEAKSEDAPAEEKPAEEPVEQETEEEKKEEATS